MLQEPATALSAWSAIAKGLTSSSNTNGTASNSDLLHATSTSTVDTGDPDIMPYMTSRSAVSSDVADYAVPISLTASSASGSETPSDTQEILPQSITGASFTDANAVYVPSQGVHTGYLSSDAWVPTRRVSINIILIKYNIKISHIICACIA
jgi:hypothetical protein